MIFKLSSHKVVLSLVEVDTLPRRACPSGNEGMLWVARYSPVSLKYFSKVNFDVNRIGDIP